MKGEDSCLPAVFQQSPVLSDDIQKIQGVWTGTIILVKEAVCLPYRAEIQQGGKYGDIEMEVDKEACRFQY